MKMIILLNFSKFNYYRQLRPALSHLVIATVNSETQKAGCSFSILSFQLLKISVYMKPYYFS